MGSGSSHVAQSVFVCWQEADAAWAMALSEWLRTLGLRVTDEADAEIGSLRLDEGPLQAADAVVLVTTPEWAANRFGQLQWKAALHQALCCDKERLLPVVLRRAPVPFTLGDLRACNVEGGEPRSELARLGSSLLGRSVTAAYVPHTLVPPAPEVPGEHWEQLVDLFCGLASEPVMQDLLKARAPSFLPQAFERGWRSCAASSTRSRPASVAVGCR